MEIFVFILFVFLSLISILGYGKIFETIFIDKKKELTIGLTWFFWSFFIKCNFLFYSYIYFSSLHT